MHCCCNPRWKNTINTLGVCKNAIVSVYNLSIVIVVTYEMNIILCAWICIITHQVQEWRLLIYLRILIHNFFRKAPIIKCHVQQKKVYCRWYKTGPLGIWSCRCDVIYIVYKLLRELTEKKPV
ncbi:hypothetical protein BDA99DRAFT_536259 [Phascolomyces articulosus]|uniref:Uncharacterized protein n=1 Tax=Phascolomyces articulosus TaxID=60185 RepID=A0AAD5KD46_9FUNG|nr:hypothetical protein BDA99DRAFT_536259 [Phascolomyces articulosus]